jgi:hypothetical protein
MAESPLRMDNDIISLEILSNGILIDGFVPINSITINLELNAVDEAIIAIAYDNQLINKQSNIQLIDSEVFSLDREIEIRVGYKDSIEKLFKGKVTQNKVIAKEGLNPFVQIACKNTHPGGKAISKYTAKETLLKLTLGQDVYETELEINSADNKSINGYIKFQGSSKARVNDTIELDGFGILFNGIKEKIVSVSAVSHKIENGEWITTVFVGNAY